MSDTVIINTKTIKNGKTENKTRIEEKNDNRETDVENRIASRSKAKYKRYSYTNTKDTDYKGKISGTFDELRQKHLAEKENQNGGNYINNDISPEAELQKFQYKVNTDNAAKKPSTNKTRTDSAQDKELALKIALGIVDNDEDESEQELQPPPRISFVTPGIVAKALSGALYQYEATPKGTSK